VVKHRSLLQQLERDAKFRTDLGLRVSDLLRSFPEMQLGSSLAREIQQAKLLLGQPLIPEHHLLRNSFAAPSHIGHILEGISIGKEQAQLLQHLREASPLSQAIQDNEIALRSVRDQLAEITGKPLLNASLLAGIQIPALHDSVSRALSISLAAQSAVDALGGYRIGDLFGLNDIGSLRLEARFERHARAFSELQASVEAHAVSVLPDLSLLTRAPSVHFFTHADFIRVGSLNEPEDEEAEHLERRADVAAEIRDSLPALLEAVDPDYVKMWVGAKQSLTSSNPDRVRHVISSLRTLFDHIFWTLAPEEEVATWTTDPSHFHNGKPTRNARLHYICRSVNFGPFTTYVKKNVPAIVEFYAMFGGGVHVADDRFTDEQLAVLVTHAERHLRFLLEVARVRK
jgi:hypothetical protein